MIYNSHAIGQFLKDRQEDNHSSRLIKKKGQILLVNKTDLSRWVRFQSKIGCGMASFRKVSQFASAHQNTVFNSLNEVENTQLKQDFNLFIDHYNSERRVCWKTAKKIKICKTILSTTHSKIFEPTNDQDFLNVISEKHKNMFKTERPLIWDNILPTLAEEFSPGIRSAVRPHDHQLSNLILECQDDDEAYFLPSNSLVGASNPLQYSLDPSDPVQLEFLKETLRVAFMNGKKIVVVSLSNNVHSVAAGFTSSGDFKIIDSMLANTVNLKALTQSLNQAGIKNQMGNCIQFNGEYVNTQLQRGGHECIRFATLYCYWMFKQKSLDAFEEVNGAFLEGKLQCFEDYSKIAGSSKVRILDNKTEYKHFMQSWAYRTQGLTVDRWEDIPMKMMPPVDSSLGVKMKAYSLKANQLPMCFYFPVELIIVEQLKNEYSANNFSAMPVEQEIPITDLNSTLGELVSPDEKCLLLFEENNERPRLYRLLTGQKLYSVDWTGERTRLI